MWSNAAKFLVAVALASVVHLQVAVADPGWRVVKSSGEVWVARGETQLVALGPDSTLNSGDSIRTGRTGRVLLTRGEERILISPNSAIALPQPTENGLGTRITQQAGSIFFEVEKKNVQHFEVETPYLAAVVKGTQFTVVVKRAEARVEVVQGQVQVSDNKSGQKIVLMPGQAAKALATGASGLVLSGTGRFNQIEQGQPRPSGLRALSVPKGGLQAPQLTSSEPADSGKPKASKATEDVSGKALGLQRLSNGTVRIGTSIGEVKLDYRKVTNGLIRSSGNLSLASNNRRGARESASNRGGPQSESGFRNGSNAGGNGGNGNGLGLGLGVGNGSGNGNGNGGNGLSLGLGGGNGGGSGGGNGNGLSLGVGGGNGGGNGGGIGLSLGGGNGGGSGLSLGVGIGNGVGVGLTTGNGTLIPPGLAKKSK